MKVKKLIEVLNTLDLNAVIDMSSDEEGNCYGDISEGVAVGKLFNGETVYTLYPDNAQMPEDRYLGAKGDSNG